MQFCPSGLSLFDIYANGGISRCFFDSTTSLLVCLVVVFGGLFQGLVCNHDTRNIDPNQAVFSAWIYVQVILILLLALGSVVFMILQTLLLYSQVLYGYQILQACLCMLAYFVSLRLIFLERSKVLASVQKRRHGCVLLLFFGLCVTRESLALVSWRSKTWWWALDSTSDFVELGFWIFRYLSLLILFLLAILGWSLPTIRYPYEIVGVDEEAEHSDRNSSLPVQSTRLTWTNVVHKVTVMLPYVWPSGHETLQFVVLLCLAMLVAGRVLNVYIPLYSKYIVDSLTLRRGGDTRDDLVFRWDLILISMCLLFLKGGGAGTSGFLNNLRSFLWIRVQQYTARRIQVKLFSHLHSLSLRWHLQRKTGEVLRVVDRGTNSINNLLSYVVFQILPTVTDIVIAVVYFMMAFNYLFGLLVFASMVMYLAITVIVTEWRTKFRRSMNKLDNEANGIAVDSLLNFETVKYYGGVDYEMDKYQNAILGYQVMEWRSSASLNLLNILQSTVTTLGYTAGALLCAWVVVHSMAGLTLTVGDYVLFSTYLAQLFTPLNWLGTYYRMIQQSFIDMENMFELLDEDEEVKDIPAATDLEVTHGLIEFRNVSFRYLPSKPILQNVSFTVQPGKTLALVGHTGCGKSTIIRLLFRFYDINSGAITIDGQNITTVSQKSLRHNIGVVPQDTVLFNSSIRQNIRYGRLAATDGEVEEVARLAHIHSQILTFPHMYSTVVGERGLKLSGGEKQRVAIARTLLKSPPIILLDEATSALDTRTERQIQHSLERVCVNRTTIVIAHRLSTVIQADKIIVLRDGQIIESGRHEELLAKGEHYADMWQQQLQTRKGEIIQDVATWTTTDNR